MDRHTITSGTRLPTPQGCTRTCRCSMASSVHVTLWQMRAWNNRCKLIVETRKSTRYNFLQNRVRTLQDVAAYFAIDTRHLWSATSCVRSTIWQQNRYQSSSAKLPQNCCSDSAPRSLVKRFQLPLTCKQKTRCIVSGLYWICYQQSSTKPLLFVSTKPALVSDYMCSFRPVNYCLRSYCVWRYHIVACMCSACCHCVSTDYRAR